MSGSFQSWDARHEHLARIDHGFLLEKQIIMQLLMCKLQLCLAQQQLQQQVPKMRIEDEIWTAASIECMESQLQGLGSNSEEMGSVACQKYKLIGEVFATSSKACR